MAKRNPRTRVNYPVMFILAAVLFTAAFGVTAAARGLWLLDSAAVDLDDGVVVFAFSTATVNRVGAGASVWAFFSDLRVEGALDGRVTAFFSTVKLPAEYGGYAANISPHWVVVSAVLGVLQAAVCVTIYALKPTFFDQCAAFLTRRTAAAAGAGAVFMAACVLCGAVFVASIVFAPVGAMFLVGFYVVGAVGEAAAGLVVGKTLVNMLPKQSWIHKNKGLGAFLAVGWGVIAVAELIPYVGAFISAAVLPVLGAGALFGGIYNRYWGKTFYEID